MKRASFCLDADVCERAVGLLLEGKTMREIAAEVGASRAALGDLFKHDERASAFRAAGSAKAGDAADRDLADDYRATARAALAETRRYVAYAKGNGANMEPSDRAKVQGEVRKSMDSAMKWRQLLAGRPTAHTKSERAADAKPTDEEARVLAALKARRGPGLQ